MARQAPFPLRFDLGEVSGALGDLGTFIPIVVSLTAICGLDMGAVLLFAGLANIASGLIFRLPIPVQPMKAIAAVAIAESLSQQEIAAAGIGAGVVVLLFGITNLIGLVERHVPMPIVRGIQLGVGLKLLIKGLAMVHATRFLALDSWVTAAIGMALIVPTARHPRFPSALIVFCAGLVLTLAAAGPSILHIESAFGGVRLFLPSGSDFEVGLLRGTLPQVPLTLLNSVIALCVLSGDLFPGRRLGTRPVAVSVGMMNLLACPFGAMPMCHGAGGLAGQYRFGARTGGSVVMLGAAKVLGGLLVGGMAAAFMAAYPRSILGVLLVFAGVELAMPARDIASRNDFMVVLLTAGGVIGLNTAAGVAVGLLVGLLVGSSAKSKQGRSRGEQQEKPRDRI